MSETPSKPQDLATRAFENFYFTIAWIVFLGTVFVTVGLPVQRALVVFWVRGKDAYFHQGIRVLKGRPIRFSDGELVPRLPDALTGFAIFLITAFGLSLLMMLILRYYERHFRGRENNAA